MAIDSSGNVLIADSLNRRVRMVDHPGIITTVAVSLLEAFVRQVEAERGNRIDEGKADHLVALAQVAIDAILGS